MASRKISIITLGDGTVGKSSLLKMYDDGSFNPEHIATYGKLIPLTSYRP
jgi:GTPase SAR1 family protein